MQNNRAKWIDGRAQTLAAASADVMEWALFLRRVLSLNLIRFSTPGQQAANLARLDSAIDELRNYLPDPKEWEIEEGGDQYQI